LTVQEKYLRILKQSFIERKMGNVRLIDRTFDILELFLTSGKSDMRLSELAQLTGLDEATVNRIAATLIKRGYLRQQEKRGKYSLGMKFLDYSGIIKRQNRIRDIAMPYLFRLSQLIDETVILSFLNVQNGHLSIHNETIHTSQPLRIVPDEGTQFTFHCTSSGKIFLSAITKSELDNYLNFTELKAYTANTITDVKQLKTHLMMVAKEGISFDDEEHILGARGVSTGIKDSEGKLVAVVSVLGPTIRLTRKHILEIASDIKRCALEISKQMGYKGQ